MKNILCNLFIILLLSFYSFAQQDVNPVWSSNSNKIKIRFTPKPKQEIEKQVVDNYEFGHSDVDYDLPVFDPTNENTFVFIIANEKYQNVVPVSYAISDGRMFKEYCSKVLAVPETNIKYFENATYGTMLKAVNLATQIVGAYGTASKIIFYYAGHGVPNESDKSAYLLPVDGSESEFQGAYKLEDLYAKLTSKESKQVVVILDACFSGSVRDDGMLAMARGVKIKPKEQQVMGNMLVLSAASGDETAYPFKEKGHGMFTYFLLKKLKETNGDVTVEELSNFVQSNVKQQSLMINSKSQTPQVIYSTNLEESWRTIKLK